MYVISTAEMECEKRMKEFKRGLIAGLPIALGYISVSFTFGLMAVGEGLAWWEATLISLTNLTSAGQFAALPIMVSGAGAWFEMFLTQFIINLRYALMSLALSQKVDNSMTTLYRCITGFANTDEIFAVAMSNVHPVGKQYMFGLMTLPIAGWSLGTLCGALLGEVLPASICSALGIAIYGMFMAIIIPEARKSKEVLFVILIAVSISCMFYYVPFLEKISSGFVIIIAAVIASAVGAWLFPVKDEVCEGENT